MKRLERTFSVTRLSAFLVLGFGSMVTVSIAPREPTGAAPNAVAHADTARAGKNVAPEQTPDTPRALRARGRLVCLAEEMKDRFEAGVQPVHDHLLGFRLERTDRRTEKASPGSLRYYTILRTAQSEALFVDERFSQHVLILSGRVFPGTGLLEVSGWQWERDGKIYDVYYWCGVCTIRGFTPGACACCQKDVVLREEPARASAAR